MTIATAEATFGWNANRTRLLRLNVVWRVSFVAERLTQFLDRGIQTVIEVDEGIGGPEALANLIARDQLPGLLQQDF
jgi:hypothetical protein